MFFQTHGLNTTLPSTGGETVRIVRPFCEVFSFLYSQNTSPPGFCGLPAPFPQCSPNSAVLHPTLGPGNSLLAVSWAGAGFPSFFLSGTAVLVAWCSASWNLLHYIFVQVVFFLIGESKCSTCERSELMTVKVKNRGKHRFLHKSYREEVISSINFVTAGVLGWLSQLDVCLWLGSWCRGPEARPLVGLPARWGTCFSLSLCPSPCLCVLTLYMYVCMYEKKKIGQWQNKFQFRKETAPPTHTNSIWRFI